MGNVVNHKGSRASLAGDKGTPGRIREFARAYGRLQERAAANSARVSVAQCHVLSELSRSGPIALTELSRRLEVDKGWVSRTVDALEQTGLAKKSEHPSDRRLALVSLTRTGRTRAGLLNRILDEQAARVLSRLGQQELEVASRGLDLLLSALKEETESAKAREEDR
jgi:DNA-binding MarR family transcriptional regulator